MNLKYIQWHRISSRSSTTWFLKMYFLLSSWYLMTVFPNIKFNFQLIKSTATNLICN